VHILARFSGVSATGAVCELSLPLCELLLDDAVDAVLDAAAGVDSPPVLTLTWLNLVPVGGGDSE
jgi:hypothetical protein